MQHTQVKSSTIRSVGYDERTSTLEVAFVNNAVYSYSRVPKSVYDGMLRAKSIGKYFDSVVKKGGYAFHQVR